LLLKKMAGKNIFVALLITLGLITMTVLSIFLLTALIPDTLGQSPVEYELSSVYEFEPWSFEVDYLGVQFSEGGIIATLNEADQSRSFLLIGNGDYSYGDQVYSTDNVGGIFMVIEDFFFEEIRGSIIFLPVEDRGVLAEISELAGQQTGVPVTWKRTVPITFQPKTGLIYYYLISPDGKPILPPQVNCSNVTLFGTFAVHALLIIVMMLLITIFTLDHQYSRYWVHLRKTPPGTISFYLILPLAAATALADAILEIIKLPDFYSATLYAIVILALIMLVRMGKIDYLDMGLRRDRVRHGYLLGSLTALLFVLAVRGIPNEIYSEDIYAFLLLPLIFVLSALPRELIWRGFIQAVLSRKWGPTRGLIAMILLSAASHVLYLAVTAPWTLYYPYTYLEVAVLVPGLAAILGYLYLRTENVLASALMHSLILWLPGIIIS
jgi:membrane protease YdiL (CAAX protease family)